LLFNATKISISPLLSIVKDEFENNYYSIKTSSLSYITFVVYSKFKIFGKISISGKSVATEYP